MSADSSPSLELVVVVPVRDRPELVHRAVESILGQTPHGAAVAVVVVDDGSVEPLQAAAFGDGRVSVARTVGSGVASARNHGVEEAAEAVWVTFLDSDDEAKPGWLDAILTAHRSGYHFFSCGAEYRWAHGDLGFALPQPLWAGDGSPRGTFLAGTFSLRRDLFVAAGGYRDGLRHGENTELGWRLSDELRRTGAPAAWTEEAFVTVNAVRKHVAPSILLESAVLILQHPPAALLENRTELANLQSVAGVAASRLGLRGTAVQMMWGATKSQPARLRSWVRLGRAGRWRWSPSP